MPRDWKDHEVKLPVGKNYHKNASKCKGDEQPCCVCGKPCKTPKHLLWIHHGGDTVVSQERGEWLNENGHGGADLGGHPIGPECIRYNPQLKKFAFKAVTK